VEAQGYPSGSEIDVEQVWRQRMAADGMAPGGPSEAEMQQMFAQMRESPVEQVLVEVVNALLQAIQVKLGRPDARLLIDVVAAVSEGIRDRAEPRLVEQVSGAVSQLRMAQVEAEGAAAGGQAGAVPTAPPAGPSAGPGGAVPPRPQPGPAGGPRPAPGQVPGQTQGARLWVPGR
jgi:hypothetical protein